MGHRTQFFGRPTGRTRWPRRVIMAAAVLVALQTSSRFGREADGAKPATKAWLDARNVCVLPLLSRHMPKSGPELSDALLDAYRSSLKLAHEQKTVQVGGSFPAISSLSINLSDARVPPGPKVDKEKTKPNNKPVGRVGVDRFELVCEPLVMQSAKLHLSLNANDAHLLFEHDRRGKSILLLNDARDGELHFAASEADLERLLVATAREAAEPYGLQIKAVSLRIRAATPHSITAGVHVSTVFGFVPAGMTFKAHVEIDDAMNARLTNLTCDGDDVLGPLIVGLLRPGLKKYEGISRPLVSFPSPAMKLHDVGVTVDDQVHLNAAFGR